MNPSFNCLRFCLKISCFCLYLRFRRVFFVGPIVLNLRLFLKYAFHTLVASGKSPILEITSLLGDVFLISLLYLSLSESVC